jgi:hypothetical protein
MSFGFCADITFNSKFANLVSWELFRWFDLNNKHRLFSSLRPYSANDCLCCHLDLSAAQLISEWHVDPISMWWNPYVLESFHNLSYI